MVEEYVLDSVVREALQETKLGEFSRKLPDLDKIGKMTPFAFLSTEERGSTWSDARITYTFGDILLVAAFCKQEFGMPKGKYVALITQEDIERKRNVSAQLKEDADKKYKKKLVIWEREHPTPSVLDNLSRPMPEGRVVGRGQQYGILVDSHRDKMLYTTRVETIIIQYIHPDAIMNITQHEKATEMTKEQLVEAMNMLKDRYTVETGYLKGREQRNLKYSGGIGSEPFDLGPKPIHKQDNVFQRVLTGAAFSSTDAVPINDIVTAVKSVYDAGEAFKAGIYRLREEKSAKEQAAHVNVLRVFG